MYGLRMAPIRRLNRWALEELLERCPHTYSEVARDAETAPSTLSDLKSGRRDASDDLLARIAEALDADERALRCDPYELLPALLAVLEAAEQLSPHLNGHDFGLRDALSLWGVRVAELEQELS